MALGELPSIVFNQMGTEFSVRTRPHVFQELTTVAVSVNFHCWNLGPIGADVYPNCYQVVLDSGSNLMGERAEE